MRAKTTLVITVAAVLTACKSVPATVKPTPPIVRCEQPPAGPLPAPPRGADWVTCAPVAGGGCAASLSAAGASWITSALQWARGEQAKRAQEHACTDELAKKGVIQK